MTGAPVLLSIEKLVGGGAGLAHEAGATWFVQGALPGELVEADIVKRSGRVVHARAVTIAADPSPLRDRRPCPHAGRCGGCDWPHVRADREAPLKALVAAEAVGQRLRERVRTAPVTPSARAYRLRARLHWDPRRRRLGFYRAHSWEVADIDGCVVLSPALRAALEPLQDALGSSCVQPADVEWLENLDGSCAVAALRPGARGPGAVEPAWVPPRGAVPAPLAGFHVLTRSGRLVRVWGDSGVTMQLPVPLWVPAGAFFQGNRHLVPWLFERVGHLAGTEPVPVWDLHAGVGFLAAAVLARAPRPSTLVEAFRPAATAAAANVPAARVFGGWTAERYVERHPHLPSAAMAITDPPRHGLSVSLRRRLAEWHPHRILMLGCDPATWGRDAGFLLDHGYVLGHLELIDLFPSTHHVEVLAVLESR